MNVDPKLSFVHKRRPQSLTGPQSQTESHSPSSVEWRLLLTDKQRMLALWSSEKDSNLSLLNPSRTLDSVPLLAGIGSGLENQLPLESLSP